MIRVEHVGPIHKFHLSRTVWGRNLYFTTAYWVDGLMVDTGCSHTLDELVRAVQALRIERIVNTHSHEDHVAANAALQARSGAPILAHEKALPILRNPKLKRLRPYQLVMWGCPPPSIGTPIGNVVETDHHSFEVVHTPGHSPDHICLFEPKQGWLFCGDAYVGGFDKSLRLDYNVWQIIESLKKLALLEPRVIFPGSGSVKEDPLEDLTRKIAYLEEKGEQVLELYGKGWSRNRIRRAVFGPEMLIAYITLGHFTGRNLVRSYIEDRAEG